MNVNFNINSNNNLLCPNATQNKLKNGFLYKNSKLVSQPAVRDNLHQENMIPCVGILTALIIGIDYVLFKGKHVQKLVDKIKK